MLLVEPKTPPILQELGIDPQQGLTSQQVQNHRTRFGSNKIDLPHPEPWWKSLLEKFQENPIPILVGAAIIAMITALIQGRFPFDGIAILIAVILATGVGFINEYKSNIEYEQLKLSRIDIPVTVTRDGTEAKIKVKDIVVGDIVHLEPGTKIPADGLLLHSESMFVDQSRFNGEAAPALKDADDQQLYGGTDVVAGTGLMIVTKVGNESEWGRIARELATEEQETTPLEERLNKLTELINKVGTIAAIAIFVALAVEFVVSIFFFDQTILTEAGDTFAFGFNAVTAEQFLQFFIIAVTIVVVAVPEGLPMAVNVSLALSMRKIQADNNLVRKMLATETIGAADVILTDKTGTLTENKMTVTQVYLAGQRFKDGDVIKLQNHPKYNLIELNSAVNSTAHLITKNGHTTPDGNSTEGALLSWVAIQGTDYKKLRRTIKLLKRIPFDAEIKRMTSIVRADGQLIVLVKGAPERILPLCCSVETDDGPVPIDGNNEAIQSELNYQTNQAMRSLALAYKILPDNPAVIENQEGELTLLALVGIADPMRKDVPEAIEIAHGAGIEVKMVTGDNARTAAVLAERLGLLDQDSLVMEGEAFRQLEDRETDHILPRLRVLARAEPFDKRRLVKLLQAKRQVVAVTGDGTNDALALKDADVGLAMGLNGTEVAKEASDIVLLDDNFYSIVKAVHWGRALYENIQKFLQFQLTINLSALLTAFLSPMLNIFLEPLFGIRLLEIPLTVVQLLWVNLIMDTLAVLALCLEAPVKETMQRKPVGRNEEIITPIMRQNILGMGLYFTLVLLTLMATNFLGADKTTREFSSVVFTTYVFFQVFNLFNARALHITRSPFAGLSLNSNFARVMILIVVIQVLLTTLGGEIFNTAPLSWTMWLKIILLTSTALIFGEIVRWIRLSYMQAKPRALQPAGAR